MLDRLIRTIGLLGVAVLFAAGCSSSNSSASEANSALEASFGADLAAIDSIDTFLASQSTLGRADLAQALLAYLKQIPQFVNPGISDDGTVYATLADGVPFSIETNDPTIDIQAGTLPATKAASATSRTPKIAASGGEQPGGAEAFVIDAFSSTCESPAATITSELKAAGYHVTTSSGRLSDWTAVSNAAVLFNSSHGARVPDPTTGALVFWQQSGQEPLEEDASWARPLIKSGALMIDKIPVPPLPISTSGMQKMDWVNRYTFSYKYLTNPTMFAENSLFWDESCSGASNPGRDFVTNLQQHNGLDLFAGWSQPVVVVDANETSSFFFDRAFGLNQFQPVDATNPPPNDWTSISGIMQTTNRASLSTQLLSISDPSRFQSEKNSPIAALAFINGSGTLATLIPSIAAIAQDTTKNELTLTGSFGTTPGTVTIGTTSLKVKAWTPATVTTELPTVTGDVQVVSPFKTLSNKFPFAANPWLGVWPGNTTSTCGYYSGQQTLTITSLGGNKLSFGSYSGTYDGNTATSTDGKVTFTLDGNTIHGHEADSCQTGLYTRTQ